MSNILVLTIRRFATGHCNEETLLTFDYFNVMNDIFVIDRDGSNRLHLAFFFDLANTNISNVHNHTS